jgi:hypothetical protein
MASVGHAEVESRWRTTIYVQGRSQRGEEKNRRLIRMTAGFSSPLSSISISLNDGRSRGRTVAVTATQRTSYSNYRTVTRARTALRRRKEK